jgi:hypothetical protein
VFKVFIFAKKIELMRWIFTSLLSLLIITTVFAQSKVSLTAKQIVAEEIIVDGKANEKAWSFATPTSEFVVRTPNPGSKPLHQTEVKVVYDDQAVYVFASLFDNEPDKIQTQLSKRDDFDNVDWFTFVISPYNDGINGVNFLVTAAGVQYDSKYSVFDEDANWNAVWQSEVVINEQGWFVEMKIPYSAIRFPEKPEQEWGVNFIRSIRRTREQSSWSPIKPEVDGFLNQAGLLKGIKDITPPLRLFLFPYVSGYAENFDGKWGTSYNGGMDLKYGISDAFTLDVTLVPDFGQVQSDNRVLNLSPFEVRFNENRQFFTEGTELFNKGELFYSRRIGGFPHAYSNAFSALEEGEEVTELPVQGRLVNASKLSGRTSEGLGVGVFNAITRNSFATLKKGDETRTVLVDPSTNYNVLVLDQNLKNNSYITLINTNVTRAGNFYDANVTGTQFRVRNNKNTLQANGGVNYSNKYGASIDNSNGFAYSTGLDKIGGKYQFGVGHELMSNTYDINDLGFLYNNNEVSDFAYLSFTEYEQTKRFNRWWSGVNLYYQRLYKPSVFTGLNINANIAGTSKKFHTFGVNGGAQPVKGANYFEPRIVGRFYETAENFYGSGFISSDYRKRFALDVNIGATKINQANRYDLNYFISPRFRFNDKSNMIYQFSVSKRFNEEGYSTLDSLGTNSVFGRRNVKVMTNVLNYNYIFTNKMALTLRVRHYWSTVSYQSFHALQDDGLLAKEAYNGNNVNGTPVVVNADNTSDFNRNYNSFNIDLVYTWVFAPGSELRVVWKNNIEQSGNLLEENLSSDFKTTIEQEQLNSFSIKLLYFIDYASLRKKG